MTVTAFGDLASTLPGCVLTADDPGFDEAVGVHQLAARGRPAAVVRPADPAGVAAAIAFARGHGLEIAVRGGGHSVAGHSTGDGVLVIDMRGFDELSVDPRTRRVRAGAGLAAGALVAGTHAHGLTVPLGDNAAVGVAGITLGGGVGYLSRRHGLTIDSLRAVELVTADGREVRASAESEPELFWALRGGGGNFGVVTAFEFEAVEAGMVYGGALVLPATRDVLRGIVPLAGAAPRELTLIANLMPAPPAPFIPPDRIGQPAVLLTGAYCGDLADGPAAWAPFRELATPIADVVSPLPYPVLYKFTEAASTPMPTVTRSMFLDAVDDALVDTLLAGHAASPGVMTLIQIRVLGGAVGDVAAADTAYGHRSAPVLLTALTVTGPIENLGACRAWGDDLRDRLRGHGLGGYVNFLEDEGGSSVREAYPATTYRRLARVKAAWDPHNVFRRNQNIRPEI